MNQIYLLSGRGGETVFFIPRVALETAPDIGSPDARRDSEVVNHYGPLRRLLKKSLSDRAFKNSKCKARKKFKVVA